MGRELEQLGNAWQERREDGALASSKLHCLGHGDEGRLRYMPHRSLFLLCCLAVSKGWRHHAFYALPPCSNSHGIHGGGTGMRVDAVHQQACGGPQLRFESPSHSPNQLLSRLVAHLVTVVHPLHFLPSHRIPFRAQKANQQVDASAHCCSGHFPGRYPLPTPLLALARTPAWVGKSCKCLCLLTLQSHDFSFCSPELCQEAA